MVENMCKHYGDEIAVVNGQVYYDFPTIEALAGKLLSLFHLFVFP